MPFTQYNPNQNNYTSASDVLIKKYQEEEASKNPKRTLGEKILGFTGGEKIAQGLGQASANPEIAKQQEAVQTQQMDIQGNLIKAIKAKGATGEDATKLEKALADLNIQISDTGNQTGELLNQKGLTTKQVVGDALQLGTTVLGVGKLPGATKAVTSATSFGKGLVQGAKTGAISGGAFGTATGVSQGLQKDKDLVGIVKEGLLTGAGSAVTGGILGGVIGGTSGAITGRKTAKLNKEQNFLEDLVQPKATEKIIIQALKEGRVTENTLLQGGKIKAGARDKSLAEAVKGFVSSKKTNIQNIDSINEGVSRINTGVKAYVKVNKVPFNSNQLRTQLNKGRDELKLVFASDATSKKTYDALVTEFMKHTKKLDTAGLLDARQSFDKLPAVKKLLDSKALGENAKKEIVLTVRGQANKYVASLLPKGNQYRETLLREHRMIEAIGNLTDKTTGIVKTGKLQTLIDEYPILKWFVGGAVGGGVIAGGAVIGSID